MFINAEVNQMDEQVPTTGLDVITAGSDHRAAGKTVSLQLEKRQKELSYIR